MDLATAISREVKANLVRRGMSQADLAAKLGVTPQGISYRLSEKTDWDIPTLSAIARVFGVRVRDIVGAAEDMAEEPVTEPAKAAS